MQRGGSATGVDIEPKVDEQADRVASPEFGGTHDQIATFRQYRRKEFRVRGDSFAHRTAITSETPTDERAERIDGYGLRTGDHQEFGDRGVAVQDRAFVWAAAVVAGMGASDVRVDAARQQQADPPFKTGLGRMLERFSSDLGRSLVAVIEEPPPWTAVPASEP